MENYQFIRQIGQGSYGEVWLVKCSKTRKKYVLKRINLQEASKREQRAAHLEAKLLSTVKHPNIVTYLDSFYNSKGNLFIVMGYCECGDLYTYIKNRNGAYFQEKQIVDWFVQICMALKYLHDKNILHRDLKTQNIFLTKKYKLIKVGDLGIARILNNQKDMATTLIGTPYYMSPEIFAGKPYNHKSDVWALGCCIYEMATLKKAFNACDIQSVIQKVMRGKLSVMPKLYSPQFLEIISQMLNHAPENRPSVAKLLLNDYIRKHILFFLRDSPIRSKSTTGGRTKVPVTPIPRSKSSCDLPLCVNNVTANVKYPKSSKFAKEAVISIPDVNGNGDGNDNSQHRNSGLKVTFQDNVKCPTINRDIVQKKSLIKKSENTDLNNSLKENLNPTPNKNSKKSSQHSFQLLNNLTYTLKNTRFVEWENRGLESKEYEAKYGGSSPQIRPFLHSVDVKELVRQAPKSPNIPSVSLPQITMSKIMANSVPHPKTQGLDLPLLDQKHEKFLRSSSDAAVDKQLLQKIMQLKKGGAINSAARQRRREMQKKANSVPTVFLQTSEKENLIKLVS